MALTGAYSVVIATAGRTARLADCLESQARQTLPAAAIFVVDASPDASTEELCREWAARLPLQYHRALMPGAARQRNQVKDHITTPLVAFMDDDVVLEPDLYEKLCACFACDAAEETGGVAARMRGTSHARPGRFLKGYYRLQAGYDHPHYGGRLFGPAINCFPCYEEESSDTPIPAGWLNTGCVMFRTRLFQRHLFPDFEGYSHMEDVYLSAGIAKTHRLYFHPAAWYDHYPSTSPSKRNRRLLARQRFANQRRVAREIMQVPPVTLFWKLSLHRLFVAFFLIRFRPEGWKGELFGTLLPGKS